MPAGKGIILNDGRSLFSQVVANVKATVDFPSIDTGAGATSSNIPVTGAALGDFVLVGPIVDTQGLQIIGWVSAANVVKIRAINNTGAAVDLASAGYNVKVLRG
ncbi:hypothetical protein [Paenibacillus sp. FSL L8-0499]|uniref:hypothetical protein n=1 Tax=Paenibacillus sp. FSL L8-0499 TaxID=2975334 RepID=UPI0030F680CA